jgi:acetolactate synthase I/II/III large subunit
MNAVPEVVKFYETVDLMLVAGTRLRGHETRDLALPLPAKRAQIDVDPQADGRTYATDLFVAADCRTALSGLADRLEQRGWRPDPALADDVARVRREATDNYLKFLGAYAAFPVDLRAVMPRDALWVRDITLNNSTWGNRIFPVFGPNDSVYPVGAAIGPGMQLGIGAAMAADGRKTVCMCGDGGFFMNLSELWTAVQENAEVVFVVMNDRGYGVIKHIQDAMYDGRQFFGDLMGPELKALAATAGVPYWRVDRADGLGTAVAEALKVAGPTLVEVDMAAIGPYPRYFAPPPFAEKEKKG